MSGWGVVDVFVISFPVAGCADEEGARAVVGAGAGAIGAGGRANGFSRGSGLDGLGDIVSIAWSLGCASLDLAANGLAVVVVWPKEGAELVPKPDCPNAD